MIFVKLSLHRFLEVSIFIRSYRVLICSFALDLALGFCCVPNNFMGSMLAMYENDENYDHGENYAWIWKLFHTNTNTQTYTCLDTNTHRFHEKQCVQPQDMSNLGVCDKILVCILTKRAKQKAHTHSNFMAQHLK